MAKLPRAILALAVALLTVATATIVYSLQKETGREVARWQEAQWQEVGQLPISLESHGMVALNGFVYVLGGWNESNGPHSEVFFAPLTLEGRLDDWQQTTAAMPLRLQHHAVMTHNNALYVLGGDNGFWENSRVSDRIFRAVPNDRGDIAEWVEVGKLPQPRTVHAVTAIGDRVYVLGGTRTFRPGTEVLDTIFTATISPEGRFGEFQTLSPFPNPISWLTATTVDRRIFAISGRVSFSQGFGPVGLTAEIWVAEAEADLQLSPFEAIGTTAARGRHATVLLDRTLVLIGGGGANGALSTVEAAEVDPQGNLSAWRELAPLPEARFAHAAFARDGYIYVSGGFLRFGDNATSRKVFRLTWHE
ncbi:hypothetical protein [Synechococcus sp. PCC 7336]|uniref:Kelch repeat-containing protein n=1 Tax=Synechococcus sp. PCC 7336 TaxID=195250 RepID=UPI00034B4FAF|nr:hypothetical protein [Synechococcus sp. PCC 7336]